MPPKWIHGCVWGLYSTILGLIFGALASDLALSQDTGVPRRASVQECRDQAAHINDLAQEWDPPSDDEKRYLDEKLRDFERCCQPVVDTRCIFPWRRWPSG